MGQGVTPITPQDLLTKLVNQLALGGTPKGSNIVGAGLADRVFLTLWSDRLLAENPVGKQFVAVRPNRFPVWQTVVQGAGAPVLTGYNGQRTMTGFNTVVSLVCFNQINADPDSKSVQALTEASLGVISFVLKVISAVQFWNPFDPLDETEEAKYLREPARMTDGGFGLNQMEVKGNWWLVAPVDIELKFTAKFGKDVEESP